MKRDKEESHIRSQSGGGPKKRVFINGAGGFIGRHVVEEAAEAGYGIVASDLLGKDLSYAEELGAEIRYGDLCDLPFARGAIEGCNYVINVAGLFDLSLPYETLYRSNVRAPLNVCRAALAAGVEKLVHIASITVYGKPFAIPLKEEYPLAPRNSYEITKAIGETLVLRYWKKHGLPTCSLRPGAVYGPYSRYGMAFILGASIVLCSYNAEKIPLPGEGLYFHIVHAQDLARASLFLLDKQGVEGQAFNCGDDYPTTWRNLLELFFASYGKTHRFFKWSPSQGKFFGLLAHIPDSYLNKLNQIIGEKWDALAADQQLQPGFRPRIDASAFHYFSSQHLMDNSRLKELGFEYRHPDPIQGLKETIEWYKENKWIPLPWN